MISQNDLPLGALAALLAVGFWTYVLILAALGKFADPTHLFNRQLDTRHPSDGLLVFLVIAVVIASFGPVLDFAMMW